MSTTVEGAIDSFRDSYIQKSDAIITQLEELNQTMSEIASTLASIDQTNSDFYDRASDKYRGVYFNTAYAETGSLSRAVLMTSLDSGQIDDLRDELVNPTPLPGDQ